MIFSTFLIAVLASCSKESPDVAQNYDPISYYLDVVAKDDNLIDLKDYHLSSKVKTTCWVDLGMWGFLSVIMTYDGNAVISKYDSSGHLENRHTGSEADAAYLCSGTDYF